MNKFAGLVLDVEDDRGETLRRRWPTLADLPALIKNAQARPTSELPNEKLALCAVVDGGQLLRKYAHHDAGSTAISVVYLLEHGHRLPAALEKRAAQALVRACIDHQLQPPLPLVKRAALGELAGELLGEQGRPTPETVDARGSTPRSRQKTARGGRFALESGDGRLRLPIDTHEQVKCAARWWGEHRLELEADDRRRVAEKIAARAQEIGQPIDEHLAEAGALSWAPASALRTALELRKLAFERRASESAFLDELFEKRAALDPETYAEVLRRFDVEHDLDHAWGQRIPDPWSSTFGIEKLGAHVVWEEGPYRVTVDELNNLATNFGHELTHLFTEDFAKGFERDPRGIFESMPLPQKKRIARLAADLAVRRETSSAGL